MAVDFRPIESAPRDGTLIILRADDAPDMVMRWNASGRNALVQPGPGIWETETGDVTWSEYRAGSGPTHWRIVTRGKTEGDGNE